ncbi:hypothetical protein ACHAPY_006565 [Fusarium culmorum]
MSSDSSVVYHYLAIGKLGRGEVVKLFLKDAGLPFEEKRYPYDDTWKETSEKLQSQGITRTGLLPSIEYKGLVLSQAGWVSNLSNASEDYKNKTVPKYHDVLEKYYCEREGPYLLGDEVSYADFAVYMSIDNDTRTKSIPVSYSKF